MKKIIFPTMIFLSIAGFASAQTTSNDRNSSTKYISTTSHQAKKAVSKKAGSSKTKKASTAKTRSTQRVELEKSIDVNNKKEYMKDGQLATPTGHEAAPINGEQFQSLKDTAKRKKQ